MIDWVPVVLHIGAHKTASSMLQNTLRQHAEQLRDHGLSVVLRERIVDSAFYQALRRIVLTGAEPEPQETELARASFADLIDSPTPRTLLSTEDLLEVFRRPRFYRNVEPALRWVASLTEQPLSVVLYTRNQPDYLESMYLQRIHLGDTTPFEEIRQRYGRLDMSWARVLDNIAGVVGRDQVTAIPYESINRVGPDDYYQSFIRACGIDDPGMTIPRHLKSGQHANRSYSQEALRLAMLLNPLLAPEDRRTLRKYLQTHYSTATHPRAVLLDADARRDLEESYRAENERLFETYLPQWREDSAAYGLPQAPLAPRSKLRLRLRSRSRVCPS